MTRKRLYIIILSAVTALFALALFLTGFSVNTSSLAKERLEAEILSLEKKSDAAQDKKNELSNQISDLETELSTKDTVNNYYMEYQKNYDQLTSDIAELEKQSAELDEQISQKQAELDKNSGITGNKRGKVYSLSKGETYTCPDKIPAGRYIVTGHGTLIIYNSSGRARATENLDVAYGNSYTFDLNAKEKITVSANATLTELK